MVIVRNILAVIAGFVVGSALISAVQYLNYQLNPPPPGLDPSKAEDIVKMMEGVTVPVLLMVEFSYLLGSLGAGFVSGKVAASRWKLWALVLGTAFTIANFVNMAQIPHPLWFAVLTTVTFLPLAWLGARLAVKRA
jgi:hypothetical protein